MLPLLGAIIGAGLQTGGSILSTSIANRQTFNNNMKMYERQRKDALADWNMMNDYNSPSSQMKRLQDANLNPNLVYGNGATTTASPVRAASAGNYRSVPMDLSALGNSIGAYADLRLKEAQTDNLKEQNTVLKQESALKAASTSEIASRTARNQFDLDLAGELRQTSVDAAKANLRSTEVSTDVMLNRNEREAAMNSSSIREAATRIAKMRMEMSNNELERERLRASINAINSDNKLRELDINMKRMGVQPSDNYIMRILAQALEGNNNIPDKIMRGIEQLMGIPNSPRLK